MVAQHSAYPVSVSVCSRLTNVCRCRFDTATSTPWSVDLPAMFGVVSVWLHGLGTSTVSCFALLHLADTHALNLELYRLDLDSTTLALGSNDPIRTFGVSLGWLRCMSAFQVSHFDFLQLADVYRCNFDSSMSTSTLNGSVRMVWTSEEWPR